MCVADMTLSEFEAKGLKPGECDVKGNDSIIDLCPVLLPLLRVSTYFLQNFTRLSEVSQLHHQHR